MQLYHFTTPHHVKEIFNDEFIDVTESNIGSPALDWRPHGSHWGPDVVWLLDTTDMMTKHAHGVNGKNNALFVVDVPAIRWLDWAWTAQMNKHWRHILIETGGGMESAEHWYVFPNRIRWTRWREIRINNEIIWDNDPKGTESWAG